MKSLVIISMLLSLTVAGQLNESFADGNFTAGPAWGGHTAEWQVVANSDAAAGAPGSNTLRLSAPVGSGTKYLSTQLSGSWGMQQSWGFWLGRRAQAATTSNVAYVWLFANEPDLTSTTIDGYRIRFGDDAGGDELVLEAVSDGAATAVITSSGSVTNGITDYGFLVRVTRSSAGTWNLYSSTLPVQTGTGAIATDVPDAEHANIAQGSAINTSIAFFDDGYIGIAATHTSGAAARAGIEFDQLIFRSAENGPLPVRFGFFSAINITEGVRLRWTNMTETDIVRYTIEKAEDGFHFTPLKEFHPIKNDGGRSDYEYMDRMRGSGISFYRVSVAESNGNVSYSSIVRVVNHAVQGLQIFPNPASSTAIMWQADGVLPGRYTIRIFNDQGQLMRARGIIVDAGSISQSQSLSGLRPGNYILRLSGAVILQKKFVVQ